jgi:hypothetical protein
MAIIHGTKTSTAQLGGRTPPIALASAENRPARAERCMDHPHLKVVD